jgi:hypothetical protein
LSYRLTPRRVLIWAGGIGAASAVVTFGATAALARSYRPAAPGETTSSSEGWLVLHTSAASILGMAAFAALLVLVWPTGRRRPWRRPFPIGLAAVATLAAAIAIVTRDMLTFDQIALATVRVGEGISGYWFAAFDDDVAFVIVGGSEVGQAAYARALVVHLLAPILAGGALAVAVTSIHRHGRGS